MTIKIQARGRYICATITFPQTHRGLYGDHRFAAFGTTLETAVANAARHAELQIQAARKRKR